MINKEKLFILGFFVLFTLSIPVTLSLLKKPQDIRSHAATASTTLSFSPTSSVDNPIQNNVGDTIPLTIMVDPGNNLVSLIRLQIAYDPTKLTLSTTDPFTVNTTAFPTVIEGPLATGNNLDETVSVGADPTKAIQTATQVGTLNFTAIGGTNGSTTTVVFTSLTQALSIGSSDSSYQSVLESTTPATIIIGGGSQATPSATPSASLTTVSFDLLLHGIGAAGDNPNPNDSDFSNQFPIHPQRKLVVQIIDSNNQTVANTTGAVNYDSTSGSFKGSIGLDPNFAQGSYSIKVTTPGYLRKLIPGVQQLTPDQDNPIAQVGLTAGDTNSDNALDILDYNAFLDCGYGELNPLPMNDPNSTFNSTACQAHTPTNNVDINDDGIIDSTDYNLFLRELSVQNGD